MRAAPCCAALQGEAKERFNEIQQELSQLSTKVCCLDCLLLQWFKGLSSIEPCGNPWHRLAVAKGRKGGAVVLPRALFLSDAHVCFHLVCVHTACCHAHWG